MNTHSKHSIASVRMYDTLAALSCAAAILATPIAARATSGNGCGRVERVSLRDGGLEETGWQTATQRNVRLLGDGNRVAFASTAIDLESRDKDVQHHVFLRDLGQESTRVVSLDIDDERLFYGVIGADVDASGRTIVFESRASRTSVGPRLLRRGRTPQVYLRDADAPSNALRHISVGVDGEPADGHSHSVRINGDGRFVFFVSDATNLVLGIPDEYPIHERLYVHDRLSNVLQLLVVEQDGTAPEKSGFGPVSSSHDGAWLAFASTNDQLVANDDNEAWDVFLLERSSGNLTLVSRMVASDQAANGASGLFRQGPAISGDGTKVAFASEATDIHVDAGTATSAQVYLFNRASGQLDLVTRNVAGDPSFGLSYAPTLDADGDRVAFVSSATDLPDEAHDQSSPNPFPTSNVYVFHTDDDDVELASKTHDGEVLARGSCDADFGPLSFSANGRALAFGCDDLADRLVDDDTNTASDVFRWTDEPPHPFWAVGIPYDEDQLVAYGPECEIWQVRQSHTSQDDWRPPGLFALWQRPTPEDGLPWTLQTHYVTGSVVTYEGNSYAARITFVTEPGWTPTLAPSLWEQL